MPFVIDQTCSECGSTFKTNKYAQPRATICPDCIDRIEGTWEEAIQRNEQSVRDLELRVVRSKYRELRLWKDNELFTIEKGNAASTERWGMWTPKEMYYGDSIEEVLYQAADAGYPVLEWCAEFNER